VDGKVHSCISGDAAVDIVFDQVYGQKIYFRNQMVVPAPGVANSSNKNRRPIVIDVGGNVGFFSEQVAQMCPNAEIHTVEPIPELAECCRLNVKRYLKDGVHHMHQVWTIRYCLSALVAMCSRFHRFSLCELA
jgi:methylase of polypeptide subunit release factors